MESAGLAGDVDKGLSRKDWGVTNPSDAQAFERSRFRSAYGAPRSIGCRSVLSQPESEWRQWVGRSTAHPSVVPGTYCANVARTHRTPICVCVLPPMYVIIRPARPERSLLPWRRTNVNVVRPPFDLNPENVLAAVVAVWPSGKLNP